MKRVKRPSTYTGGYNYGTSDQPFEVPLAKWQLPANIILVDTISDCDSNYSKSDVDESVDAGINQTSNTNVTQTSKRRREIKSKYECLIDKFGSFAQIVHNTYNAELLKDISKYRTHIDVLFHKIDPQTRPLVQLPFKKDKFAPLARDALDFGIYTNGYCPIYRRGSGSYRANCKPCKKIIYDTSQVPKEMPPWMIDILRILAERLHLSKKLNHVVIHRYIDKKDKIGFHHDKDLDLDPDGAIVCISIGESRRFAICDVYNTKQTVILTVNDGDVICMSDTFNSCFKHSLLTEKSDTGIRYSITARCVCTWTRV